MLVDILSGMTTDDRHPATKDLRLTKALAALSDPVRLATVRTLAALGDSPCVELHHAAGLTISQPTFSHHQRVLRQAGIIRERVQGAQRILSVRREDLDACFPGLLDTVLNTPEAFLTDR
ncbi:helix-turn-helix transcriptional regulator [Actinoallomurus acanthiterrae]